MLVHCRDFLIRSGWPSSHIQCLGFRDRYGSNLAHAEEIADAIASLRYRVHAESVDVVAHSMGGLALRWLLGTEPGTPVNTAIFAGTPHAGTWAAWLAWGGGGAEMRPGSRFLRQLASQRLPVSLRAHSLRTPIDTRVFPSASAWLEGTQCHVVRAPTHQRMLRHGPTLHLIRDLLR